MRNFFKSFIVPLNMLRFRHITIFIPICIFLLISTIYSIPLNSYGEKYKYDWDKKNNAIYTTALIENLKLLADIPADNEEINTIVSEIVDLECTPNESNKLECNNMGANLIFTRTIKYSSTNEENTINYTLQFSIDLKISKDINERVEIIGDDGNAKISTIDDSAPVRIFNNYVAEENEIYHIYLLTEDSIYFSVKTKDTKTTMSNSASGITLAENYGNTIISTAAFGENGKTMGSYIAHRVSDTATMYWSFQLQMTATIFYGIFAPLIVVVLFWFLFRKNGRLKTFKEYYNIGGIAAIIPAIISFVILWFYPLFLDYQFYLFALFYVFVLFKINSTPEIV